MLPVIHSIIDPGALIPALEARYDIGGIAACLLYRSYANDVYRIIAVEGEVYYLKVYRNDWRSASDVDWELRIQRHVLTRGVSIARPVQQRDGSAVTILHAPEGQRAAVLFAEAAGAKPRRPFTAELYTAFGSASAGLHAALDAMPETPGRPPDDIETLVLAPGQRLREQLDRSSTDHDAVEGIVDRLANEMHRRMPALDWGICHGDLTLDNVAVAGDGSITFYDFDLAAPSWRARDPCGVYAASRLLPHAQGFWDAFLAGYRQVQPFSDDDERAAPLMYAAQQFWDLGHEVSRWTAWSGQWRIQPETLSDRLMEIQRWIEAELG